MDPATTQPSDTAKEQTAVGGLFRRELGWRLTRRGWAALVLTVLIVVALLIRGIHPFLSPNAPVESDVLVVEGWMPDYGLLAAAREAVDGGYEMLCVAGGPIERGAPLSDYGTYAALGAAVVESAELSGFLLEQVPAPKVRRDRTYASALAVRDWLAESDSPPGSINVMTVGTHARRTRLLYEEAFGGNCEVGVISVDPERYEPRRWWRYSEGVREVVGETVAYVYARFLFKASSDRERD